MALLKHGRLALQVGLGDVEPKVATQMPILYALMHDDAIWHLRELCLTDGLKVARPGLQSSRLDFRLLATQDDFHWVTTPSGTRFVVFTHKPSMTSVARWPSHDGSESSQTSSLSIAPACRRPSIFLYIASSHGLRGRVERHNL